MFSKGILQSASPWRQLILICGFILAGITLFEVIGLGIGILLYGSESLYWLASPGSNNPELPNYIRIVQTIVSLGTFILPSLLFAYLISTQPKMWLKLALPSRRTHLFLGGVSMFLLMPFVNLLGEWNSNIHLPEGLTWLEDWVRSLEATSSAILEQLLNTDSTAILLVNLAVIAVIPAIGEEFLFRGVLQRIIGKLTRNTHVAVWITAFLFSAIHMQFLGFLPRFVMGAIFGYMLVFSGSIWVPVCAHFVNNAVAVLINHFIELGYLEDQSAYFGVKQEELIIALVMMMLGLGTFYAIYRTKKGDVKHPLHQL